MLTGIASAVGLCAAWVVLAVSLTLPAHATAQQSVATDRAALVALFDATGGPAWTNSTNWKTPAPLGEWHGVTTDAEGRVTGLSLPANGLAGQLPAGLGRLGRLRVLALHGNELTGPVPRWLGRLTHLRSIDLGSNALTGPVPAVLERLGELEYLSLGGNALTGLVPGWLGGLVDLRLFDLGANALTGPIPSTLERLSNLEYLSLGGNRLTGPLPAWLGGLAGLRALDLGANRLSGPIPARLGDLTRLEWLGLDRNELVGAIPDTLEHLGALEHLSLGGNDLVGPVPTWLGRLVGLARLDLHGNGLHGPLPDGLRRLAGLEHLSLRGNELSGPAPPWLGDLANLRVLDLGSNPLSGSLPPTLGNLVHLEALHVDGTSLTGPLPPELTRPPALALLAFHDSALCAPADVRFGAWLAALEEWTGVTCNWPHPAGTMTAGGAPVSVVDLFRDPNGRPPPARAGDRSTVSSGTSVDDGVRSGRHRGRPDGSTVQAPASDLGAPDAGHPRAPAALDAATGPRSDRNALIALYDATGGPSWKNNTNWKTGRPLGEWHGVTTDAAGRVVGLDLDSNELTGRIPPALGRLNRLQWLSLGGNTLTGRIPRALGRLTNLFWLSLWSNQLTGRIPDWIGQLTRMALLSLWGNRLTGPIPDSLGQLTNLDTLALGRNQLSGAIPPALGRLTNLSVLNLGNTALTGRVPPELRRLTSLQRLYLDSWGLTGRLPAGLRRAPLTHLRIFGSQTCAPTGWRNWLRTIDYFDGALCGSSPDATIDVLVVYTPAVSQLLGGTDAVEARIDLLIAETNAAYRASGVRPRVALAGRSEVSYTESGSVSLDHDRLADTSDGHMDRVHAMRRRTGADLVHLLVTKGGIASLGGDFSVGEPYTSVFAHELGHNMGLQHDRYVAASRGSLTFAPNHGYVNQRAFEPGAPASSRWITIMAYFDQCAEAGLSCRKVMRFSNPRHRLRGDPLGVPFGAGPSGVTGPADAAAWLNRVGRAVAARRDR